MLRDGLQKAIRESELIISRSGYSTIMDLYTLQAKAFFIPTPGQDEQEYLAKYLEEQKTAPFASQKDFKLNLLENSGKYSGFQSKNRVNSNRNQYPFDIFQSE
jgi:UDP-N-acetylglucosamine:LPS N-acetylglucosamine transferase